MGSFSGAKPGDDAGLIPTLWAGRPYRFFPVAVRAPRVDGSAKTAHRCPEWNIAIVSVDGVTRSLEWEPYKRLGFGVR